MAANAVVDAYAASYRDAADLEARIVEGALRCIARWGVAKTTLDDVAREAGCSRATVYRAFPGGKDRIVNVVLRHEIGRFFHLVHAQLEDAETLEDLVVTGMSEAMRFLSEHEALRYLLAHEPELILPHFAFHRLDRVLSATAAACVPYLERFLDPERAAATADWVVRLVLSYSLNPGDAVDPGDVTSVRRLVRTFVLPGLAPVATEREKS